MDGFSRWDLVLWVVVAYLAVTSLVRLMLHQRDVTVRRLRDQVAIEQRRKTVESSAPERRDAA